MSRWVTLGLDVRSGPDASYSRLQTLQGHSIWHRIVGKDAAHPKWWRIQVSSGTFGWVHAGHVDTRGDLSGVAVQTASSPAPANQGSSGEAAQGTSTTSGAASGPYRNLVTNPDGRWSVTKTGTEVTAHFSSPRSPVQYYARQNPQPQFVLPVGFRPTVAVPHEARGTHVHADRTEYEGSPTAKFDLTIGTNGELRYVNNSKVDHVGYLKYQVTGLQWQTAEAVAAPDAPTAPTIGATGTYHNQQENRGSGWSMNRTGDRVEGTFTTTSSPVEYYANQNREALVWLPTEYWPERDESFQVKGAVQVDREGTALANAAPVNFRVTVRSGDGRLYYDRDAALTAAGVGYLSYSLSVEWDASPRVTVPSEPRDLEVDDVEADEVELDWRSPSDDGGDAVDEYKVEVYRSGRWREVEDDISRTGYDVEDLDPYTTYTFRVRARNRAGWSAPSTAVTVTTPREMPGEPGRPTATATHERVTLTWSAAGGSAPVTGYRLQRRTGSGTWRTLVTDTGESTPGWVDYTVTATTTYSYRVAAHNHGVPGDWSSARSVTTTAAPTIPGQATGLTVSQGTESRLQLSWTVPAATGGGITGYRVERSPDETPRVWAVIEEDSRSATANWGDDVVAADTVYWYRVSAQNSAGVGLASGEAMGRSRPQLTLGGALPYPLQAYSEPRTGASVTTTFATFLPGRVYDLVGRVPGADGWWRVLLLGQAAQGPFWLPAAAGTVAGSTAALPQPPAMPGAFAAALSSGVVSLSWTAPGTGATVTGYRVWRQEDDGAFAQLGSDLAAGTTAHTDSTVRNDHVYRYWLQALSAEGPGLATATEAIAVMAAPAAPAAATAVTATATGTTLQLNWTQAATGGLPAGYRVAWRVSGSTADFETASVAGTSHELGNLTPGTAYAIRITAFNQEGDAPAASHTASTVQVAPGVPASVAVAVTGQDATATWEVPASGGPPDEYHLQSKTQATVAWPATHTTVTGLTHSLTGLGYAVAHDLRVRASNTAGQSAWVEAAFTTEALPRVPGTPTGLTAAPTADSRMQLTWTAPADAGSPALAGYRVERAADAMPRVWVVVAEDTGSTAVTWDDAGLTAATVYHYRVSARNRTGVGTASTEASGTTRPQAALLTTATYPLTARAWPEAAAPATHTWAAHDASLKLDVVGKVGGASGWWRVVRFGAEDDGPFWLPAAAVTVAGATTGVSEAPGMPGSFRSTAVTHESATLTWSAPTTGGTVTGYRLWRRTGTAAWTALDAVLNAASRTHSDSGLEAATVYQYRLQALSAAGAGPRTAAVSATMLAQVPPLVRNYGTGRHTLDFPAGYTTFFAQLCGGGGGGAGGRGDAYNGGEGGDGGCTFHATNRGGHAWTLVVGDGGEGGEYDEYEHRRGSDGESTVLQRDGITAVTAAGGQGGQGSRSRSGSDGATVGSSQGWPADWTSLRRAPRGGRGGAGFHEEDGRDGAAGQARILFTGTPSGYVPVMPTELTVAPGLEGRLRLTWEEGATVGPATGYRIERSADVDPLVWTEVVANTGTTGRVWHDNDVAADTVYHYRVTGHNAAGWGSPSLAAEGRTRPQATLLSTAAYPLTAHAWPAAAAPATHTWAAHDAAVKLDVVGQVSGTGGWYRVLRFGESAGGPYWLPAASVNVTGATTTVPAAPGVPGDLAVAEVTDTRATLTWTAPATGGTVTGYRLWRQTGAGAFALVADSLAADVLTHTDTGLVLSTGYRYRLQALSAGGPGIPTEVGAITAALPPVVRNYGQGNHTLTVPAGYDTLYVQLCGGGGGGGGAGRHNGEDGGRGGTTHYTAGVMAGDVLALVVGAGGDGGDGGSRAEAGTHGTVSYLRVNSREVAIGTRGRGGAANTSQTPNHDGSVRGSSTDWPASWPGDVRRPAGGGPGFTGRNGGDGGDGADGLARVLLTPIQPPVVPGIPTALTASPSADSRMRLRWTAPATGAAVTGYRIERAVAANPLVWADAVADTGSAATTWDDAGLAADTTYHYRVTARSDMELGDPAPAAEGTTRPQAALSATATYPLSARAWPLATAPATHSWAAHDAAVKLDVVGQGAGGGGWYRVLRFGERIRNVYWLPTSAVTVTGVTTNLPQAPGAPGNPASPTATHDRVTLTWTAPTTGGTVTGYRVWRQTGAGSLSVVGDDLAADVLTHTDTTVAESTAYQYRVQALSAAGAGERTAAVGATTAATPREPGVPTALSAAPGADSRMQLSWTAPADGGTQPITGYRIERSADVDPRVWTEAAADTASTATTWSDSGLAAATTHHYRVSARNSVGVGAPSEETSGTTRPQAALSAMAAYPLTARRWPAATAPASHVWSTHDSAVQLDVAGQVRGTSGWWRVLRFGAGADGPYWLPAAAVTVTGATAAVPEVPGTPTALTAAPGDESSMQLSWTAATAGGAATGYRIERSADVDPRVWTEAAADTASTATTWSDSGLAAATRYHYRVAGRNAAGPGVPSAETAGLTRPQLTLLDTAAYPLTAHQWPLATAPVSHTWTAHDAAVKLEVLAQGAGGGGWFRVLRRGESGGPFWLPAAAVSVTGATTDLPRAPGAPGDFATPAATHDTVTLTWTAPATGGTVTGYRLWRQTGAEAFAVLGTDLAANVLTYTDAAVAAATAYQYRVQALAAAGAGVRNPAVGVTTAAPPRVPGAPTGLEAAPGDDSHMVLSWAAPTDAGTQPIGGYRVERSADVWPRVWTDAAADTGTAATTWSDSGLTGGTTYHYQVSARNSVGVGLPSGETDGKTRPQAALLAAATYPLTAHAWPAATAPTSHTWTAHDAAARLDVVGQGPGGGGWYRVLRFGQGASGPYWLPAAAVTVTGSVTDVPEAPGVPGSLEALETHSRVVLTWQGPATGGYVTGYRLWRQVGEAAWSVLTDTLDGVAYEYTDSDVAIGSSYQYRLQAQSEAGHGPRTVALAVTVLPPPPPDPAYFGAAQTGATTVDLAWDAVSEATGYEIEIEQSHGDSHVRLPASGTFSLRTGAAVADVVTVTVTGTGTTRRLTGLPAGYTSWDFQLRATNAGGSSYWDWISVSNDAANLAPAPPTGLTGRRSAAGTAALSWPAVPGATGYRVYFLFSDDDQGPAGWDWLPHRGLTVTVTGTAATVGSLPTAAANWGFRVSAFNGTAESLASTPITVANTTG